VHRIVAADPAFALVGNKSEISRAIQSGFLRQGPGRLAARGRRRDRGADRELAFRCCARVLSADGDLAVEDAPGARHLRSCSASLAKPFSGSCAIGTAERAGAARPHSGNQHESAATTGRCSTRCLGPRTCPTVCTLPNGMPLFRSVLHRNSDRIAHSAPLDGVSLHFCKEST